MIHSVEDFQKSTPPRIMGSETEYTTNALPFDGNISRYMGTITTYREKARDDGQDLWLENGAHMYVDSGGLLEYATPEVTNASDVALYELAGERTVQAYAEVAAEAMSESEGPTSDKVYKRSGYAEVWINDALVLERKTTGHHENYLTPIHVGHGPVKDKLYSDLALSAFLSTRAIWAGGGLVSDTGFEFSQKMNAVSFGSGRVKTTRYGQKPAYLEQDPGALSRLEIRLGDGNMSAAAIIRKFAVTSLVLRLIEHGKFPSHLFVRPGDADETFRRTSRNQPIVTRHAVMAAAKHQRYILEAALEFADANQDTPEEESAAATATTEVCRVIENLPPDLSGSSSISGEVDWAAKLNHMRAKGITDIRAANLDAVMLDLKWEDIAKDGDARRWYRDESSSMQPSEDKIAAAEVIAPATRADARVKILKGLSMGANDIKWSKIESRGKLYSMGDPYDPDPSRQGLRLPLQHV